MGRAQFGDFSVFGIGHPPCDKVCHHDPLIGHNDEKHIGRHDGGGKSPQMQKRGAASEDLIIAPSHGHQKYKEQNHQQRWIIAQL